MEGDITSLDGNTIDAGEEGGADNGKLQQRVMQSDSFLRFCISSLLSEMGGRGRTPFEHFFRLFACLNFRLPMGKLFGMGEIPHIFRPLVGHGASGPLNPPVIITDTRPTVPSN